jgi:hypothetical protein
LSEVALFAKVARIADAPSQGVVKVTLEVPIEWFKRTVDVFHAQECLLTIAPPTLSKTYPYGIIDADTPEKPPEPPEIGPPTSDQGAADPEVASPEQRAENAVCALKGFCRARAMHEWLVREHAINPPRRAWGAAERQRWAERAVAEILEIPELDDIDVDCLPRVEAFIAGLPL